MYGGQNNLKNGVSIMQTNGTNNSSLSYKIIQQK